MPVHYNIIFVALAYLIGSVPTAVWLGKMFYSTDIRDFGSGNAGATNTFRVLGPRLGVPVLLIDVLKGFLAVKTAHLTVLDPGSSIFVTFQIVLGTAALAGHIFPVYAQFKGGKGIATLLGFMLAVEPQSTLVCIGVFTCVLLASKIVSLSSITAAVSFPVINIFVYHGNHVIMDVYSVVIAFIVIVTHRKNIARMLRREESKVKLKKRRSEDE